MVGVPDKGEDISIEGGVRMVETDDSDGNMRDDVIKV